MALYSILSAVVFERGQGANEEALEEGVCPPDHTRTLNDLKSAFNETLVLYCMVTTTKMNDFDLSIQEGRQYRHPYANCRRAKRFVVQR